jgi:hypothetical protein
MTPSSVPSTPAPSAPIGWAMRVHNDQAVAARVITSSGVWVCR